MKTKIIPFNLKIAKKIQIGEKQGKIKTRNGYNVRIICWDRKKVVYPIIGLVEDIDGYECVKSYTESGNFEYYSLHKDPRDLVLEVPDNEQQFKPFDKVLVRNSSNQKWHPNFYAMTDGLLFYTTDSQNWHQCIPYTGNEHLLGTTDKPNDK